MTSVSIKNNSNLIIIGAFDEGSFRFSYPMDVNLKSNNTELILLNVETFHCQMNAFHDAMENLFNSLSNQVDNWELDKDFRRQFKLVNLYDNTPAVMDF